MDATQTPPSDSETVFIDLVAVTAAVIGARWMLHPAVHPPTR